MTRFSRLSLFASAGFAVVAGTPALAQQGASDGASDRDVIIVTAQKREQQLLDVPLSVQALAGEELEQNGVQELNDLIRFIPGATQVSRTSPGFETISIRGISSGTTGDATVGYYVDDVAFGVPNLQLAPPSRLFDLQRAEVLRGPQGTLYGQGAMGGMIKLVTGKPDFDDVIVRTQAEASSTEGGEANYGVDAVFNAPIAAGRAGLRVTGGYEQVGGFADIPAGAAGAGSPRVDDVNDITSWNVRGKFGVALSDTADLELSVWRVENEQDCRNTITVLEPPQLTDTGPLNRPNYINSNMTMYSALLNVDTPIGQLTSATGYIDHELDFDASFLSGGILRNDSLFSTTSLTQEIRLAGNAGAAVDWLVGAYYSDSEITSDICLSLVLPCTTAFSININSLGTINTTAWALFGDATVNLSDRFALAFGARYFEDERTSAGRNRTSGALTGGGDTFETFNPRVSLSYKAGDDHLLYFTYAKGFRSGAIQTPSQVAAAAANGIGTSTGIAPDTVWSRELGAKGRLFSDKLTYDLAIYDIDWTDMQLQFTVFGVAVLANGGEAHSRGIDLGLIWEPVEGLQLQIVGNRNEAEFDKVVPAISTFNALLRPGKRIPGVPEQSLQVAANYEWGLARWNARAFAGVAYAYRDVQIDTSGLISDEFSQIDLRAGLSRDNWRLQAFAENLTNESAAIVRGSLGVQPQAPRRVGVRLGFDF